MGYALFFRAGSANNARNVKDVYKRQTITLPAVTHVTADYKAMGTYTAPMTGQIEGMEAAITKICLLYTS